MQDLNTEFALRMGDGHVECYIISLERGEDLGNSHLQCYYVLCSCKDGKRAIDAAGANALFELERQSATPRSPRSSRESSSSSLVRYVCTRSWDNGYFHEPTGLAIPSSAEIVERYTIEALKDICEKMAPSASPPPSAPPFASPVSMSVPPSQAPPSAPPVAPFYGTAPPAPAAFGGTFIPSSHVSVGGPGPSSSPHTCNGKRRAYGDAPWTILDR